MRKYVFTALCGALAVAMFSACGGGSSSAGTPASSNGELFGEVSAAVIESAQKQADFQAKVEKIAESGDVDENKLTDLEKQSVALQKEVEGKIDAAAKKLVGKKIPYKVSEGLFYTITSEPTITKAFANGREAVSMDITYRAAQKEAMEIAKLAYADYPICYKLVDAKGDPVWVSMTYIVTANSKPVKFEAGQDYGTDFMINFSINKEHVDKRKDAAELVFISKDEYDTLKKTY